MEGAVAGFPRRPFRANQLAVCVVQRGYYVLPVWEKNILGEGITVAIIDYGIDGGPLVPER